MKGCLKIVGFGFLALMGLFVVVALFGNGADKSAPRATAAPLSPSSVSPMVAPSAPSLGSERTGEPDDDSTGAQCDPSYPDVCIPPLSIAGDLNCPDVPQFARFRVLPPDPHGFDNEGDGLGCENN